MSCRPGGLSGRGMQVAARLPWRAIRPRRFGRGMRARPHAAHPRFDGSSACAVQSRPVKPPSSPGEGRKASEFCRRYGVRSGRYKAGFGRLSRFSARYSACMPHRCGCRKVRLSETPSVMRARQTAALRAAVAAGKRAATAAGSPAPRALRLTEAKGTYHGDTRCRHDARGGLRAALRA